MGLCVRRKPHQSDQGSGNSRWSRKHLGPGATPAIRDTLGALASAGSFPPRVCDFPRRRSIESGGAAGYCPRVHNLLQRNVYEHIRFDIPANGVAPEDNLHHQVFRAPRSPLGSRQRCFLPALTGQPVGVVGQAALRLRAKMPRPRENGTTLSAFSADDVRSIFQAALRPTAARSHAVTDHVESVSAPLKVRQVFAGFSPLLSPAWHGGRIYTIGA